MKALFVIFLCMGVYGLATEHKGAGLLAFAMAGLMVYGARELRKRDIEYYTDPRNAKVMPDTLDLLQSKGTEAGGSRF